MNRKYQLAYELTNTQQLYPHVMSQLNFFFKKICFFFLLCFVLSKFNYYSRHNRCESMDYYNIFILFVLFLLVEICPSLYMSTWEIKKKRGLLWPESQYCAFDCTSISHSFHLTWTTGRESETFLHQFVVLNCYQLSIYVLLCTLCVISIWEWWGKCTWFTESITFGNPDALLLLFCIYDE